jgi:arylsulfatase A-like enzyme
MFDPDYQGKLDGRGIAGKKGFPPDASPRDVAHLLALYDGEVRYTDETIGEMLAMLERARVLDDTLVVVTSDHGEEFKEHGGHGHHRTVYRESVHIPLIFWSARGLPHGLRVPTFVSLADVAPTILELVGLPPLSSIDGRSLTPALRGEALAPQPVLSAMFLPGEEWRRTLAIRSGEESQILWKKSDQWLGFDVARDPGEQRARALAANEQAALQRYDAEVMQLLASRSQPEAAAPQGDTATGRNIPPEIAERLRALGYLR